MRGIDGEYGRGEHEAEPVVLPVEGVNGAECDDCDDGEHAVAACGMTLPARADECVDEDEAADEKERVVENERVHEPVHPRDLSTGSKHKDREKDAHADFDARGVARRDNLLRDFDAKERHDVEHGEMQFPPEIGHAVDPREK